MNFKHTIIGLSMLTTSMVAAPVFAYAQEQMQPQTPAAQTQPQTNLSTQINNLFGVINQDGKIGSTIQKNQFDQYFTDDIKYSVNGKEIYNNKAGLYQHFEKIKQKSALSVQMPIEIIPSATGNMATIVYTVDVTDKDGTTRKDFTMSVLTFTDGKISNWNSVDSNSYNETN